MSQLDKILDKGLKLTDVTLEKSKNVNGNIIDQNNEYKFSFEYGSHEIYIVCSHDKRTIKDNLTSNSKVDSIEGSIQVLVDSDNIYASNTFSLNGTSENTVLFNHLMEIKDKLSNDNILKIDKDLKEILNEGSDRESFTIPYYINNDMGHFKVDNLPSLPKEVLDFVSPIKVDKTIEKDIKVHEKSGISIETEKLSDNENGIPKKDKNSQIYFNF